MRLTIKFSFISLCLHYHHMFVESRHSKLFKHNLQAISSYFICIVSWQYILYPSSSSLFPVLYFLFFPFSSPSPLHSVQSKACLPPYFLHITLAHSGSLPCIPSFSNFHLSSTMTPPPPQHSAAHTLPPSRLFSASLFPFSPDFHNFLLLFPSLPCHFHSLCASVSVPRVPPQHLPPLAHPPLPSPSRPHSLPSSFRHLVWLWFL